MLWNPIPWLKRRILIRSAQKKVAQDMNAKRVTQDEWNALAHKPLNEAMKQIRLRDANRLADSKKKNP